MAVPAPVAASPDLQAPAVHLYLRVRVEEGRAVAVPAQELHRLLQADRSLPAVAECRCLQDQPAVHPEAHPVALAVGRVRRCPAAVSRPPQVHPVVLPPAVRPVRPCRCRPTVPAAVIQSVYRKSAHLLLRVHRCRARHRCPRAVHLRREVLPHKVALKAAREGAPAVAVVPVEEARCPAVLRAALPAVADR